MRALLFGLLLSGCATTRPSLESVRDRFVAEARARNVVVRPEAVHLQFVASLDGAAGRCFYEQSPRLVQISRAVWEDPFYSDDTRRQVVFHELGHCLLGIREHVPNLAVDVFGERPVSIMEREPISYAAYHGREAEWLDRLFGRDLAGRQ